MTVFHAPAQWIIDERDLPEHQPAVDDVLFSLGNGVFNLSGTLPLAPVGSGRTLVGGLYGKGPPELHVTPHPSVPDRDKLLNYRLLGLAVGPNPLAAWLRWNGQPVTEIVCSHRRLDMLCGELHWELVACAGQARLHLCGVRFVSAADRHVAGERMEIVSDQPGRLEVSLAIDVSRLNMGQHDLWAARECVSDAGGQGLAWIGTTAGQGQRLCVGAAASCSPAPLSDRVVPGAWPLRELALDVRPGRKVAVERLAWIASSVLDSQPAQPAAVTELAGAAGFGRLRDASAEAWKLFWKNADISIDGPIEDQKALRYSIFQIRAATGPTADYSFGAKLLSGEWYRGCVFWDTDVFIFPYLLRADPPAARRHLLWRWRSLPAACRNAASRGRDGAQYPWEAYPDGSDATPPWLPISEAEIHVTAGVAWAVAEYLRWTGDIAFVDAHGGEILAQTARFWMSRLEDVNGRLELHNVCGPDECHQKVDNNAYTNYLVRQNLLDAARLAAGASQAERRSWSQAAARIFLPQPRADGVIEQFDGFTSLPEWHDGLPPETTQRLKQADVMMLPMVLEGLVSDGVARANYDYYEVRTWHRSSLSRGVYALVAARLAMPQEAYRQFQIAANVDLRDLLGNAIKGPGHHAAGTAMVPRIVMEGFAGLQIENGQPVIKPSLPQQWERIEFCFWHLGLKYRCRANRADNGKTLPCQAE